jgi:hypothetical protein
MNRRFSNLLSVFSLLIFCGFLGAQSESTVQKSDLIPCSVTERGDWIDAYQRGEIAAVRSTDTILVPLRLHIVGRDDGTGYINIEDLLGSVATINADFATANIKFYIDGEIDFIDNDDYFNHNSTSGQLMMAFNNDAGVVNNYFVDNPNGACGYYRFPPQDALAMANSCMDPIDRTWSHELGHYFSLPHTFQGWEFHYTTTSGMPIRPLNTYVSQNAPSFVGGRAVERADGSNCATSGDGFCDTPADYLSDRWNCTGSGVYPQQLLDPSGNPVTVVAPPLMGYANDNCQELFTEEQLTAMQTNAVGRPGLVRDLPLEYIPASAVSLVAPPSGGTMEIFDVFEVNLEWTPSENVDFYIIQLATNQFFGGNVQDIYIYDENATSLTLTPQTHGIQLSQRYWWRVRPVNRFSPELPAGELEERNFRVNEILSNTIDPVLKAAINVFPNPTNSSTNSLTITAGGLTDNTNLQLELITSNGQVVRNTTELNVVNGSLRHSLPVAGLPNGIYFLRIRQADRLLTQRVVIGN